MIEYVGINENGDYVFIHDTKGKMTVGKFTDVNTAGATDLEHAYVVASNAFDLI